MITELREAILKANKPQWGTPVAQEDRTVRTDDNGREGTTAMSLSAVRRMRQDNDEGY